jgi:SanA protein
MRATKRRWGRTIFVALVMVLLVCGGIIGICNVVVKQQSKGKIYSDVSEIPYRKVGLILGTIPIVNGYQNRYYNYRMDAAAELYFANKVSYLLLSGDNHISHYNEPESMRKSLIERGVPDSVIYLDCAGFRTFDSMVRAKKVFAQDSVTVVSQHWHNERAIYIAEHFDLDAIAFCAQDYTASRRIYWKNHLREALAKVKVVLDLIVNKQPHFLGDIEPIPSAQPCRCL